MALPLYDDCDCRFCEFCPDTAICPLYIALGGIDDEYVNQIYGPSVQDPV